MPTPVLLTFDVSCFDVDGDEVSKQLNSELDRHGFSTKGTAIIAKQATITGLYCGSVIAEVTMSSEPLAQKLIAFVTKNAFYTFDAIALRVGGKPYRAVYTRGSLTPSTDCSGGTKKNGTVSVPAAEASTCGALTTSIANISVPFPKPAADSKPPKGYLNNLCAFANFLPSEQKALSVLMQDLFREALQPLKHDTKLCVVHSVVVNAATGAAETAMEVQAQGTIDTVTAQVYEGLVSNKLSTVVNTDKLAVPSRSDKWGAAVPLKSVSLVGTHATTPRTKSTTGGNKVGADDSSSHTDTGMETVLVIIIAFIGLVIVCLCISGFVVLRRNSEKQKTVDELVAERIKDYEQNMRHSVSDIQTARGMQNEMYRGGSFSAPGTPLYDNGSYGDIGPLGHVHQPGPDYAAAEYLKIGQLLQASATNHYHPDTPLYDDGSYGDVGSPGHVHQPGPDYAAADYLKVGQGQQAPATNHYHPGGEGGAPFAFPN